MLRSKPLLPPSDIAAAGVLGCSVSVPVVYRGQESPLFSSMLAALTVRFPVPLSTLPAAVTEKPPVPALRVMAWSVVETGPDTTMLVLVLLTAIVPAALTAYSARIALGAVARAISPVAAIALRLPVVMTPEAFWLMLLPTRLSSPF